MKHQHKINIKTKIWGAKKRERKMMRKKRIERENGMGKEQKKDELVRNVQMLPN